MFSSPDPVWVTGIGCVSPAGKDLAAAMRGLRDGVRPQRRPDIFADSDVSHPVCMVETEWMREAGYQWRQDLVAATLSLACMASDAAVAEAGLAGERPSLGVSIGTTVGNALHFLNGYRKYCEGKNPGVEELTDVRAFLGSNLAASLQARYNGTGPLLTVSNACTSGTDAIGAAMEWLNLGLCDYALAGGADALSFIPYTGFNRLMIYSSAPCKPFDRNRSGLNLGEGGAMLMLERASHARKRGAKPLAVIAGYGAASDAYHFTAPHPKGFGLEQAIIKALNMADISAEQLAFVNAHGTATKENDRTEAGVFSHLLPHTPIWASKGSTGHCLGAAGSVEAAFSIGALMDALVPPSHGCDEPEDLVKNNLVLAPLPIGKKYALSVSVGFGGGNSAIVLALPE